MALTSSGLTITRPSRRPMGRVLHSAASRVAALAWEQDYFQAGGEGLTFDKAM